MSRDSKKKPRGLEWSPKENTVAGPGWSEGPLRIYVTDPNEPDRRTMIFVRQADALDLAQRIIQHTPGDYLIVEGRG